jgi:hypothetical protein
MIPQPLSRSTTRSPFNQTRGGAENYNSTSTAFLFLTDYSKVVFHHLCAGLLSRQHHTPIYIAIYAYSANLARGLTVTKGILAANVAAGLLTLVMYELTLMTPHFLFVAALAMTVNLILARMITSDASWAPLAGFALSVVMILYGESIIPFSDEDSASFADRLGELGMAAIYAVAALYVLDAYFPETRPSPENPRHPS